MAEFNVFGTGWWQPSLVPGDVVECTLRIGIVKSGGHAQIQVEVADAAAGVLQGLVSMPHLSPDRLRVNARQFLNELLDDLERNGYLAGPFDNERAPG